MIEALWLLLPVAAASGWLSAKRSSDAPGDGPEAPSDYYQGISFLLNQEEDKAIDVFLRVVEIDDDTAETHLALGSLFRQRGEVQRAIRLHKDICDRVDLRKKLRDEARLELARDYFAAGLYDWAERNFMQLIEEKVFIGPCYEGLISICERGHEWQRAIDSAHQSQNLTGANHGSTIAHYHCEIAGTALVQGESAIANDELDAALDANVNCVRAWIMRAEIARDNGDHRQAVRDYERAISLDEAIVPEVARPLMETLTSSGDEGALRAYIAKLRAKSNSYTMISTASDVLENLEDPRVARHFFKEQLLRRPSLQGLQHWARMEMDSSSASSRKQIAVIVNMLDRVMENRPTHACNQCNFKGRQLYWQCPSCHNWDSIRPILGAEGE
ncbi:MAG: lipopolysaccharide assembly protein LapB [Granulosicoccaceae bacterium]